MTEFPPLSASKAAWIRELVRERKVRESERAFVMEGEKAIRELLQRRASDLLAVVITQAALERPDARWEDLLDGQALPVYFAREMVFAKLSDVVNSAGILAVVRRPRWDEEKIMGRATLLGIYGESIQDPTNVGTIVRTAFGFGLDAVWLSPDSADPFNPKVVRAAAGAVLDLPIFAARQAVVFSQKQCTLLAAVRPGPDSTPIQDLTTRPPRMVLAFGNESRGLSQATLKQADARFHIPIASSLDSLNVASSAAIAAFYFQSLKS